MSDGPVSFEQTEQRPAVPGSFESREVLIREGLSPKDKILPVGQNIIRVYYRTPELQALGEAASINDEGKIRQAFQKAMADSKRYYGLRVEVQKDDDILELTKNPENKATLRGQTIFMAESAVNDTYQAIVELAHELGAYRLTQIYETKKSIPTGFPPLNNDPGATSATHYLDELVFKKGDKSCLDPIRKRQ